MRVQGRDGSGSRRRRPYRPSARAVVPGGRRAVRPSPARATALSKHPRKTASAPCSSVAPPAGHPATPGYAGAQPDPSRPVRRPPRPSRTQPPQAPQARPQPTNKCPPQPPIKNPPKCRHQSPRHPRKSNPAQSNRPTAPECDPSRISEPRTLTSPGNFLWSTHTSTPCVAAAVPDGVQPRCMSDHTDER
jgi:hypothetical protein